MDQAVEGRTANVRPEDRIVALESECARLAAASLATEQELARMAGLLVALQRLHGTLDRDEILAALREIIINLIGSEDFAVYELDENGMELSRVVSCGVGDRVDPSPPLSDGRIGAAARTGERYVADPQPIGADAASASTPIACVPLRLSDRTVGVIALYSLLPQKAAVEAADIELFDLLSTHAASALYCARLHARHGTSGAVRG